MWSLKRRKRLGQGRKRDNLPKRLFWRLDWTKCQNLKSFTRKKKCFKFITYPQSANIYFSILVLINVSKLFIFFQIISPTCRLSKEIGAFEEEINNTHNPKRRRNRPPVLFPKRKNQSTRVVLAGGCAKKVMYKSNTLLLVLNTTHTRESACRAASSSSRMMMETVRETRQTWRPSEGRDRKHRHTHTNERTNNKTKV